MRGIGPENACLVWILRRLSIAAVLAALLCPPPAAAADEATAATASHSAPNDPDAWRFRVALYGWAPSVAGNLTARGQTVDVNASFSGCRSSSICAPTPTSTVPSSASASCL